MAIRLARRWRRRRAGTVTHLLLFGAFTVLAVHLAIAVAWWAWFGVAVFPVAGWLSARYEQRLRTSAERFLSAAVR
ncbi:hypothetical protein [Actinoplanes utahensis]|uniref:Uncharacterized protein n=1 Tax=Actinoplanes utahensis TaxID=1869 RepID=A0A0A6UJX2_ACTUT|nr:hypothetical protein [Actinoplanes utahensis]KHD76410.1 hypothetical protein MB27_17005 [Actinoplanes utahensis]